MPFNIKTKKILSEENCKRIIMLGISIRDKLENAEKGLISEYDETVTYTSGMSCYYNNYLYECKYTTTGNFDESKWQKIGDELTEIDKATLDTMLDLTTEQINTISKILLDTEIRLDKTWSSSKIYTDIQQCLSDSKTYTLKELSKKMGASYKVVATTDEVTSTEFLYLISNGTAYDIYALIDGVATKLGDTTIDLSNYYTKNEIDNDFLKKTDADGKFATIDSLNNKIDKTNIATSISNTPSDDKILSEKAINNALGNKFDSSKVVTKNITETTDFITILNDNVDSNSPDTFYILGMGESVTGLPSISGWWSAFIVGVYNEKICILKNTWNDMFVYMGNIYYDSANSTWVNKGWKKLLTEDNASLMGIDYTYVNSTSLNINITKPGLYKIDNPTEGVPNGNPKDYVLLNIPWRDSGANMSFCNQLLFTPRFEGFWHRIVWDYDSSTYTYTEGDYSVFKKWKKISMGGVDDVPVTNIAPSDTTTFVDFAGNSSCNYCVRNGICYVSIWGVKIASTGRTIRTGVILPKSANSQVGALLTGNGDATPHAFVYIGTTGELCFDVKDANANLYGSFSYPVAES